MIDFNEMVREFLQSTAEWQWWVSQAFALVAMIFSITAMQQKSTTRILWHRSFYSLLLLCGTFFLWKLPAIIMVGVGLLRTLVLLYLSYKSKVSKNTKRWVFAGLAAILITLNIIFWENVLSILSIAVGLAYLIAFIQQKPVNIRHITVAAASIGIVFYILVFSPMNAVINLSVLISTVVALFRIDKPKKAA